MLVMAAPCCSPIRHRRNPYDLGSPGPLWRPQAHLSEQAQLASRMFEIGSSLREARVRRGLELRDVEQTTHIRTTYLAALEDDRFHALPGDAYAIAFLRTYADFLGLDSELYVAELRSRMVAEEPPPPPPPRRRPSMPRIEPRIPALVALGAVALGAIVLAWRLDAGEEAEKIPLRVPQTPTSTTTSDQPMPPRKRDPQARLVITAVGGDCWLSVHARSAEGPVLYEGMLAEGTSRRFARKRLWVRMGAPWNLRLKLNGKVVRDLPPDTGNVLVTRAGASPA
jgi:cytoskeleton protein RodZ